LKVQLKEFRETVSQTHASDQRERGMLAQEIQSLKQLNQRISEDAINLTRALKAIRARKARGRARARARARGVRPADRTRIRNADDVPQQRWQSPRPERDRAPAEDKDIVIDAKVSLKAYERFVAATDDSARAMQSTSISPRCGGMSMSFRRATTTRSTIWHTRFRADVSFRSNLAFIEASRADEGLLQLRARQEHFAGEPEHAARYVAHGRHLWRIERRNVTRRNRAPCRATARQFACWSASSAMSGSRSIRRNARTRAHCGACAKAARQRVAAGAELAEMARR